MLTLVSVYAVGVSACTWLGPCSWASLPLAPTRGWEAEQLQVANRAVGHLYASAYGATTLVLPLQRDGRAPGAVGVQQRGWFLFEQACAQAIAGLASTGARAAAVGRGAAHGLNGGGPMSMCPKLVDVSGGGEGCTFEIDARPPPPVAAVHQMLEGARFGRELDRALVKELYAELRRTVDTAAAKLRPRGGDAGGQRSRVAPARAGVTVTSARMTAPSSPHDSSSTGRARVGSVSVR